MSACLFAFTASLASATDSPPPVDIAEKRPPVVREVLSDAARIQIQHDLRALATTGTVLHIAAHPDDENTELITWLSRGRGFRAGYLSLTRGDGGQNELGRDFDEKLGVLRTQELLAARRLDGGSQFFTRAIDFGYSKSPEETLQFWDREQVLADVVRVIRMFRPDVIVTRFPIPPGSGGHGQHTASGILAVEAFKISADPTAYPEQIAQGLKPWQAKRVLWNAFRFNPNAPLPLDGPVFMQDIAGTDPVTGESFGLIAAKSRAMHKTQGLGGFVDRARTGANEQNFLLMAGEPAESDLMDGVDTGWTRYTGGAGVEELVAKLAASFDATEPAASVPALLELRAKLADLPDDSVVADRRAALDSILRACLGLGLEATVERGEIVPGESVTVTRHQWNLAPVPGRQTSVRYLVNGRVVHEQQVGTHAADAIPISERMERDTFVIPADTPLTQPYWLREKGSAGIAKVSDAAMIGLPENPPVLQVELEFEIDGRRFAMVETPVFVAGDARSELKFIPPASLRIGSEVLLVPPGGTKSVWVEVSAARADLRGTLRLDVPVGWKVTPAARDFATRAVGEQASLSFDVTAPAAAASGELKATATIDSREYSTQRIELRYDHLPVQLLQPPAAARLVSSDARTLAKNVGYLPGAGDSTLEALEQLGCTVRVLTGADLTLERLAGLDAVVIGVRAFNERDDLGANFPGLLAWVEAGGTVVAQYNRPNGLKATQLGPFPLSIEGQAARFRVTDETAPVNFLAPDHPALNTPNKINQADFEGWVQERGAYFPSTWDEASYTALLAMSDPGQTQPDSSVLIARHGKGYYVYTGLAFFRQLPAGVPGAYRLFANLISLGHE
ncbi:MAG TPA: PIG-L family deacetylase [Opitutaceae bacterium]|nr:PIG-L family deacetylase [Opitutaceae bacterium]